MLELLVLNPPPTGAEKEGRKENMGWTYAGAPGYMTAGANPWATLRAGPYKLKRWRGKSGRFETHGTTAVRRATPKRKKRPTAAGRAWYLKMEAAKAAKRGPVAKSIARHARKVTKRGTTKVKKAANPWKTYSVPRYTIHRWRTASGKFGAKRRPAKWRRNPPASNPGLGDLREKGMQLLSPEPWIDAGIGVAGFTGAYVLPGQIAKLTGIKQLESGWGSVAGSAVSTVLASTLGGLVSPRVGQGLMLGGLIATSLKALVALAPEAAGKYLPAVQEPRPYLPPLLPPTATTPAVATGPGTRRGMGDMGDVISPEDLIEGESRAQGLSDWIELRGRAQDLVPAGAIAGMDSWLEMKPEASEAFEPSSRERF